MWVRKIPLKIPLTDHSLAQKGSRVAVSDIITGVGLEKQRGDKEPKLLQQWQKLWSTIRVLALETMYLKENSGSSNASFPDQGMLLPPQTQHQFSPHSSRVISVSSQDSLLAGPRYTEMPQNAFPTGIRPQLNTVMAWHSASNNLNRSFLAPVSQNSCPSLNWWICSLWQVRPEVGMV